jgi:hypothetical protein
MRARSFLVLSAVTLVTTVAAGIAVVHQERPQTAVETGGPVLPDLADRLGDVAAVVVKDTDKHLTIHRVEGGWALSERGDYPVEPDKVRDLVRSVLQLEKAEAKTTRPERYPRLAVENVDAPGSKSKEVILQTAAGAPVAELIVGHTVAGIGAEGGTYVRIPGEQQAWLARGTLSPSLEAREWVQRRLIEIPAADIRQVRVTHADGSTLTAVREGPDASGFRLAELPPGGKLKRPDAADSLAQPFSDLLLEDIAAGDSQPFPKDKTMQVSITRTDGGVVRFDVVDQDGNRWLRFAEGAAPTNVPAAVRGMAFQVPAWKIEPLDQKLSDWVEPRSGS